MTFHRKKSIQYFEISAKSNYNFEKPFLWLARKLVGSVNCLDPFGMPPIYYDFSNPALDFVAAPALAPAEVSVDPALMEKYNQELRAVRIIFIILPNLSADCYAPRQRLFPFRKKTTTCNFYLYVHVPSRPHESNQTLFYTTPPLAPVQIVCIPGSEPSILRLYIGCGR